MRELKAYILKNLAILFFSIFLPLFAIASVIFMIQLATYTSIIKLNVYEMFKLYLFILPEALFYTLPISFFVASVMALFKLSNDNELIVVFALGISPNFILKTFFTPSFFLSAILFFDFFVMIPHASNLSINFIKQKKSEAKFNLSASEFGHQFGKWLLYIGKSDGNKNYEKIFLFNKNNKEEVLISAQSAEVVNKDSILRLKLFDGQGYTYNKEKFTQINFDSMLINNLLETNFQTYRTTIDYWLSEDNRKRKIPIFITDLLLCLFPVLSIMIALALGVVHARHNKNGIYLHIFLTILFYYGSIVALQTKIGFITIPVVILSFLTISFILYKNQILKRF